MVLFFSWVKYSKNNVGRKGLAFITSILSDREYMVGIGEKLFYIIQVGTSENPSVNFISKKDYA